MSSKKGTAIPFPYKAQAALVALDPRPGEIKQSSVARLGRVQLNHAFGHRHPVAGRQALCLLGRV